jgi:addiction module HigA family antidote
MRLAQMRRVPIHPGALFLADFLEGGGDGRQAAAARALGWSDIHLNDFLLGRRALSPEGARDLARYTETSAEFWMRLQLGHDLWRTMLESRKVQSTNRG